MNPLAWLREHIAVAFVSGAPSEPPAPPVRPEHPCGVRDCFEPQTVLRQDERETVVECPVHQCITSWETKKREEREQQIIRVQDGWRQHGTQGPGDGK